jgi:very-short-patch-repair endonuclease
VALAERQHGVVTRAQLLDRSLGDEAIGQRIRDGRLHRVHRGVYAVGRPSLTDRGRLLAAVVSCGPTAAASHFSAAALMELLQRRGPRIDVTVGSGGGRRRRGALIIHRSKLEPSEVTEIDGIPVTTPSRTITDLADVLSERRLERVLDEAAYLGLDLADLRPRRGRRGAGTLRRVLETHRPGTTRTRSELEERLLALLRRAEIAQPELNARVEGREVDFVWREDRLIVETDGWQAHGTRTAFERDRRRDADLAAAGWRVLRFSHRQVSADPAWVARRIDEALRQL